MKGGAISGEIVGQSDAVGVEVVMEVSVLISVFNLGVFWGFIIVSSDE